MLFFTSDLHFCHNREFLYKPRGFNSIDEMNEAIIDNWNTVVADGDDVYILGDLMLSDTSKGIEYMKMLNGNLHIIIGNHDTNERIKLYRELPNVVDEPRYATLIKIKVPFGKMSFYISHFPTICESLEKDSLYNARVGLFGHTHSKEKFYQDNPFMYNVALDAHDCTPVSANEIVCDVKDKYNECIAML